MKLTRRSILRMTVRVAAFAIAIASISIWFPRSRYDIDLCRTYREEFTTPDGSRTPIPSCRAEPFFSAGNAGTVVCTFRQAFLAGQILIVKATSLTYPVTPAGERQYLQDTGRDPERKTAFTHGPSRSTIDLYRRFPIDVNQDPLTLRPYARFAHSFVRTNESGRSGWDFEWVVPYWIITSVLTAPGALLLSFDARRLLRTALRHSRKQRIGLCPNCNYDLRASTTRCPECGRPIPTPEDPPPTPPPVEADPPTRT